MILLTAAGGAAAIHLAMRPCVWAPSEVPLSASRAAEARELIDPNTANYASLRRLPGLGPVKARTFLNHRDTLGTPFRTVEDLKMPSIGPASILRMAPYLSLPALHPEDAPPAEDDSSLQDDFPPP